MFVVDAKLRVNVVGGMIKTAATTLVIDIFLLALQFHFIIFRFHFIWFIEVFMVFFFVFFTVLSL